MISRRIDRIICVGSALLIPFNALGGSWWMLAANLLCIALTLPSWRASA